MISVCIATYNGEKYIIDQVNSIISQLGLDDEIIISDDGSTDNTIRLLECLNDNRIKIYKNTNERGYSKNFENAISYAQGEYIFLSDQDDIWVEGKVQKMLKSLTKHQMVISDARIVDENLQTIAESHFVLRGVKKGFWVNLLKTRYIGACMAFKREILKKAIPFPVNQYLCAHDYWLTIVSEYYFQVELIHEPLILYRRHGKNASTGGDKSTFTLAKKIVTRIYSLIVLISRYFS